MWRVNFPKTPEGEEYLVSYYCQQAKQYVKITMIDNTIMMRYFWDGISESFNSVIADRILESINYNKFDN